MGKREIAALVVAILMGGVGFRYCYLTVRKEIQPVLATWILFFVAVVLSLATYLFSTGKYSFVSNTMNFVDVLMVGSILTTVIFFGDGARRRFSNLERKCFIAAGVICIFWAVSRRADIANLATQAILVVGYVPTIGCLLRANRNTESVSVWIMVLVATIVALYPSLSAGGDLLAVVYAVRAMVLSLVVLTLIIRIRLKIKERRN